MKTQEIFDLAIKIGIRNDFRTKKEVDEYLKRKKQAFEKLPKEEQIYFDKEKLKNPYTDSTIHYDSGKNVKKALAGIDVSMGAMILAKELDVDLVINHHPVGKGLSNLADVMELQIDVFEKYGIPVNIAEKMTHTRISEVARGVNPANHFAVVDAARLLNMSLINIHTPADNCVAQFLKQKIEKANPRYVSDVLEVLNEIPEYQEARKQGIGPTLFSGKKESRCGKVVVTEITGGTEGSKEIYQTMANAGVGTVIAMHQSEDHRKAAEDAHINVIIAGHISSDSIGMNIVLDEIEKRGVKIIPFSGLIRYKRIKNN
jgi:putative NIF3 family GTP cyclohydrolase 1 type 2